MSGIDLVLAKLPDYRKSGAGWQARCPSHEDKNPSLSITEGDDGRVLLTCFAGCRFGDIVSALGLKPSDLAPDDTGPKRTSANKTKPKTVYPTFEAAVEAAARYVRGRHVATWTYPNRDGSESFRVARFNIPGDKTFRPFHRTGSGWVQGDPPGKLPLYGLPGLDGTGRVVACEGEKATDAARALGLTATTSAHGSKSADKSDWAPLAGREVVILPDADDAGQGYADIVADILTKLDPPATVRLVALPDLSRGGDIADWVDAHDSVDTDDLRQRIEALADAAPIWQPADDLSKKTTPTTAPDDDGGHKAQATKLVELADEASLFHAGDDAYAALHVNGHIETHAVHRKPFRRWLQGRYWTTFGRAPGAQAVQDALGVLAARATFDGPEQPVAVRVAECDGAYWLDLADADWQAVRVGADGWQVVGNPPVRFVRPRGVLPLPAPVSGGDVNDLRRFVNVGTDDDWVLLLAWVLAAFRPVGPYPVEVLHAEQGAGKSFTSRVLRSLLDPNAAPLRAEPREIRDLAVTGGNGWVLAFDNLSRVPPWLSDGLCRLSTGGGFATRELYSDSDETIFSATRPVLLNGIDELPTRGDLADRAVVLTLPTIPEDRRLSEADLWSDFGAARPAILGAVLDLVSHAMRLLPSVKLSRLPRMADFATWAVACERAGAWPSGAFMRAYAGNREASNEAAIEGTPVGAPLVALVTDQGGFEGTAADLLAVLESDRYTDNRTRGGRYWPKSARGLAGILRRLSPNLRALGVAVSFDRDPDRQRRRLVRLEQIGIQPSTPSTPSDDPHGGAENADSRRTVADGCGRSAVSNRPTENGGFESENAVSDGSDGSDGRLRTHSNKGVAEWTG